MRNPERGSSMVLNMILLAALSAGGAVTLYLQLGNTRQVGLVRSARAATHCSEAGLASVRRLVMENYASWNAILDPDLPDPPWYRSGIVGEAGDDQDADDWIVTIYDNEDEFPVPDPARDNDLKVFVASRCLMEPDTPREIVELVEHGAHAEDYEGRCKGGQCVNDQTE